MSNSKNWQQMTPAERRARFANVKEETHGSWLVEVIRKMCEGGSGHGSAIEAVRQQSQGKDGKQ
jgi:hypothetical protein